MMYRAYGARSPRSHCHVVLIVTSFATELATPTVTDVRTDTLLRLIYKDVGHITPHQKYTEISSLSFVTITKISLNCTLMAVRWGTKWQQR